METLFYLWVMNETQTPTTYSEMYQVGNQFFVEDHNRKMLVQVIDTRNTKTGRVSAQFENCATGEVFWETAKIPQSPCKFCPIGRGFLTADWTYDGQR